MKEIDICNELHQNFIDFSYEANSQRAFPDARDGLKPGQRACLWEFYTKGYVSSKPHVKSAKVAGGVIANWWPHSDDAIYQTFARMSQPWINNIPEVDWHGSNGNIIISGEPASSRYTEARLAKSTEDGMMQGIKKKNVPMILNFSEDAEMPEVLPAVFPRLLVNGSQGIGVTIAQYWAPTNLKELTAVIEKYVKTDELDYSDLAPDFPTGGTIINKDELEKIYETGKGKIILRGTAEIKGNNILITEMPYQVYVEPFIDDVKKLIEKGEITDIKDIYNKSDKKRLLIEIETSNPSKVLAQLYSLTDFQKSINPNQYALVSKTPKLLTLKDYLDIYIAHNLLCIKKEAEFDLAKAQARLEIVNGLLKALEDIDNIIALIKSSKSAVAAKENLINKYSFTPVQAQAIVDMKLGKLANLEKIELAKEAEELKSTVEEKTLIINKEEQRKSIFLNRLLSFTKKYGTDRKTQLTQIDVSKDKETAEVIPEDVIVILTKGGLVKKIPKKTYRPQRKNGKGFKSVDDIVLFTRETNTVDKLLMFSDKGKMYQIIVDKIPTGTNSTQGTPIESLLKIDDDETIIGAKTLERDNEYQYIIFFTKNGIVKKSKVEEYQTTRSFLQAIKLKEEDSIASITFLKNEENLMIFTKKGYSIHFESKNIKAIGRITTGVKGINLTENDEVIAGFALDNQNEVIILQSNGIGKICEIKDFPTQIRGGKGVICSSGNIATVIPINDKEVFDIFISGAPNSITIKVKDIKKVQRIATGGKVINGSQIFNAALIKE